MQFACRLILSSRARKNKHQSRTLFMTTPFSCRISIWDLLPESNYLRLHLKGRNLIRIYKPASRNKYALFADNTLYILLVKCPGRGTFGLCHFEQKKIKKLYQVEPLKNWIIKNPHEFLFRVLRRAKKRR